MAWSCEIFFQFWRHSSPVIPCSTIGHTYVPTTYLYKHDSLYSSVIFGSIGAIFVTLSNFDGFRRFKFLDSRFEVTNAYNTGKKLLEASEAMQIRPELLDVCVDGIQLCM